MHLWAVFCNFTINLWFYYDFNISIVVMFLKLKIQFQVKQCSSSVACDFDDFNSSVISNIYYRDSLKMICNDFLVVKVNCWSYVFNIMKYMWILRIVKNKNIVEKKRLKVCIDDLFTFRKWWRHTRKTQLNSLLSVECRQPIAQQHIGMTINVAIGS